MLKTSRGMVLRYMQNSGHGGPHTTPFMTIFVFYVIPQISNIEYFVANAVYKSREVSRLFLIKFPIVGVWGLTKNTKIVITRVPGGLPWPEFGMHLSTILSKICLHPKDPNFD